MRRVFTQDDIDTYADVSGDRNPLHTDPDFASTTTYGGTIAHGLLVAGFAAQALAEPGEFVPYAVEVIFINPVPSGGEASVTEPPGPAERGGARELHVEVAGRTAVVIRRTPPALDSDEEAHS